MSILKNISYWAKSNPKKARAIILISHFLIALNAILLGMLFYVMDFGELNWLVWMTAIFTLLIYALYPRNQSREQYVDTYTRRKILDFCFVLCTAFAISFGVCNYLTHNEPTFNVSPSTSLIEATPSANFVVNKGANGSIIQNKDIKNSRKGKFKKFRKIKKKIKRDLLLLKNKKDSGESAIKVLAIFGVIAAVIILGLFIAILSCHFSCSGFAALSVITLILGWGGLIYGGVVAITDIVKWDGSRIQEGTRTKKEKVKLFKRYALGIIGVLLGLIGAALVAS